MACSAGSCQTDTTVNFGIRYSSVAIACCFANVAQDVCKDGTKAFQQADDVLDTYGFRPRAVREVCLRLVEGREQDWKRDGSRACTKEQTFLIL